MLRIPFLNVAPASSLGCVEGQAAPSVDEKQQSASQPGPAAKSFILMLYVWRKIIWTDFRKENRLFVCEDRAEYAILTRQSNQCEFCI